MSETKQDCLLYGKDFCEETRGGHCEDCDFRKYDAEKQKEMLTRLDVTRALLPKEGIAGLCTDECLLCKTAQKNPRELYALTDLAHVEPKGTKQTAIFVKVKTTIGSLLPVSVSCCKRCARNHRMSDLIAWLITAGFLLVALLVLLIPGVITPAGAAAAVTADGGEVTNGLTSFLVLVGVALIGYFAGKRVENAYRRKASETTIFDLEELRIIAELRSLGWFFAFTQNGRPKLLFSTKRSGSIYDMMKNGD